jgi:hypothetical protein
MPRSVEHDPVVLGLLFGGQYRVDFRSRLHADCLQLGEYISIPWEP